MNDLAVSDKDAFDPDTPVKIADRVWWVGHYLPDDKFQCHIYLIENGNQSILIDPGSKLTFKYALRKIEKIVHFNDIRYFICQHQDPDITGSLPIIEQLITRTDAVIVSHWKAIALLKHYGLETPFLCVEENNWSLDINDCQLEFIFTPYLHFPGAFCTFDKNSGILFSSDIFGGFTEEWSLIAKDESYFESIRPFHEHYMPSREILYNGLVKLEKYPINLIAPQHGSIIPKHLIQFMFNQLKNIDCGLYLMTQTNTDIMRLSHLNKLLHNFMEAIIIHKEFSEVAQALFNHAKEILPVQDLSFFAMNNDAVILRFDKESMFRGIVSDLPEKCTDMMGMNQSQWNTDNNNDCFKIISRVSQGKSEAQEQAHPLIIPLYTGGNPVIHALAIFNLTENIEIDRELNNTLHQMSIPLSVAIEREIILRSMEIERQHFYEQAIRDPLTGLYTRIYMQEAVQRLFSIHDREANTKIFVIIFDIDNFKSVNDTYGHTEGDTALKQTTRIIMEETRTEDIQTRIGGEEFAVFIASSDTKTPFAIAERIRRKVSRLKFAPPMENRTLTISGGIAQRQQKEELQDLIQRADKALYKAKNKGRNRICSAS